MSISTSYSGVAPEEIESLITIPIEQAVSTVSGVVSMDSLSREGSSRVTLRFPWGTDLEAAANEVRASVERVRSRLPAEASAPWVGRYDPSQMPIMTLGLSGELDLAELRRLAAEEISYYLERIDGVAAVTVQGGRSREVRVELDPARLQAYACIYRSNRPGQGQEISSPRGPRRLPVPASLHLGSRPKNWASIFANGDGAPSGWGCRPDPPGSRGCRSHRAGRWYAGVTISIQKHGSQYCAGVRCRSPNGDSCPHHKLNIGPLNDSSRFIRQAVNNVIFSGIVGAHAASFCSFSLEHSPTLIIPSRIPSPLSPAIHLVDRLGGHVNIMSLGAWPGDGMLVDNPIIVPEHLQH